jgi:hypothetical protein
MMMLQILAHTPRWVFVLFAVLVWYGCKQLLAGTVSLTRVTLMPLAMTGLAVYGVGSAFGGASMALLGWAAAALVVLALWLQRPLPAATRYDAASRSFHVRGSAVPLALMMGIFFTKYAVGVALAMHPELRHQAMFAVGIPMVYGVFSGSFIGRALRLWKLAIRADRAQAGLPPVQA